MTTIRTRLLAPVAAVLLALAAAGCTDGGDPAAADAPAAGSGGSALPADEASPSADISVVTGGSCSARWTPGGEIPAGITIEGWANAFYTDVEDEPAVVAVLTDQTGVPEGEVECFFTDAPDELTDGPAIATDGAAAAPATPEASPDEPVGFGWCGVDWEPRLPQGALPDGASVNLSASASFGPEGLLAPARNALASVTGRPAADIDCSHEIPPVGECTIALSPGSGGDLPRGARVEGSVFGTYVRPRDRAAVRAAVAALAGVAVDSVRCTDFPDEVVGVDEPLPVEPGGGSAGSDPGNGDG